MSNTKKIVGVVIIVVVIAIVAVVWYEHPISVPAPGAPGSSGTASTNPVASITPSSTTRTAVPANVTVPNKGATSTSSGVAVPAVQSVGDPAGNVQYRSFSINIQSNAFVPDTVIVNQGDTVDLEITAVDANYSFTQPDYGFNAPIAKGKTQRIQFQALQSGNFLFYCSSCGGPSSGPMGHLIVVAKN